MFTPLDPYFSSGPQEQDRDVSHSCHGRKMIIYYSYTPGERHKDRVTYVKHTPSSKVRVSKEEKMSNLFVFESFQFIEQSSMCQCDIVGPKLWSR